MPHHHHSGKSKFTGAVDKTNRIYVEGKVFNGQPFLTKIGNFDVELSVQVRAGGGGAWRCQLARPGVDR